MAGLWCEDFERYPSIASMVQGPWANVGAGWALSTANPGTGAKHLRFDSTHDSGSGDINSSLSIRRIFGATKAVAGVGYRIYMPSLPSLEGAGDRRSFHLGTFLNASGGAMVSVQLGTDGALVLYRSQRFSFFDASATLLHRSDPCVIAGAYNGIEFRCEPGASGNVEIRVNGVTRMNFTGNTDTGAGEVSQFWMGCCVSDGTLGMGLTDVDDMHAWDTVAGEGPVDFAGNVAVLNRPLTADTAIADMTLSTGATGYTLLSDASDATYIASSVVGDRSGFTGAAVDPNVTGILYQQINFRAIKTAAGDCDVTPSFRQGTDETAAAAALLTTGEAWYWGIIGKDPTTAAPWTPSDCDTAKVVFERTL